MRSRGFCPRRTSVISISIHMRTPSFGLACTLIFWTGTARAADQEKPSAAPSLDAPRDDDDDQNATAPRSELEDRIDELEKKLQEAETEKLTKSPLTIRGYIDVGFFASRGNKGAGWVRDFANEQFPQ